MARRSGAVPLDIGVEDQTIENREAPIHDRILMHESMRPAKWRISFVSDPCHIHRKPRANIAIYGDTLKRIVVAGKPLTGTAVMRFGVRQHARAESISKRAP
jgi:hypothetical protein